MHTRSQKNNLVVIVVYISLPIYQKHFQKFPKTKNTTKLSIFGKNYFYRLSYFLQT